MEAILYITLTNDLVWLQPSSKKSWTYLRTVDTIAASPDKTSIEPRSREALQSLGALWAAK
jgi:hypothetical protein